jgi:alpha-methylacyl-CoA racemase
MTGPLHGVRVLEIAGLGPGPFAAMMLADMGADVLRVDRKEPADFGVQRDARFEITRRGRRSVRADLKHPPDRDRVLRLVEKADALIEGFRPGVMERLGLGPDTCLQRNPRLVYGRMTGWGQAGPLAQTAGHDINYLALSGTLSLIGERDGPPVFPGNLLGDYGGGGMYLAFGIACALFEARASGRGQVVDAAIIDGVASLSAYVHGLRAGGYWSDRRADNMVDGGAPYYNVYRTGDGRWLAVGAIEKRFYTALLQVLGLADVDPAAQHDRQAWPALRARIATLIASASRDDWCRRFEGIDACVTPVLDMDEAPRHPHNLARGTFIEVDGVGQPQAAPRFSRTPSRASAAPVSAGMGASEALGDWGVD